MHDFVLPTPYYQIHCMCDYILNRDHTQDNAAFLLQYNLTCQSIHAILYIILALSVLVYSALFCALIQITKADLTF